MKKIYLLVAASLSLASCNNDPLPSIDDNSNAPAEISLGVNNPFDVKVSSRATGAIGLDGNWKGETVHIYGINYEPAEKKVAYEINAQEATTPSEKTGTLTWAVTDPVTHYYYQGDARYDFFGAFFDGVALTSAAPSTKAANKYQIGEGYTNETGFTLPIEISGAEDLMLASTDKDADLKKANAEKGNKEYVYSSWSARHGVVPNLQFKHLLSRLVFKAKAKEPRENPEEAIHIDSIVIREAAYKAQLTVVPGVKTDGNGNVTETVKPQGMVVSEGTTSLFLQQKDGESGNMIKLESKKIQNTEPEQIGESLLVFPAGKEGSYKIEIHTSQTINGQKQVNVIKKNLAAKDLKAPEAPQPGVDYNTFEAGHFYTITVTLYSMEEVTIEATLEGWVDGGKTEVNNDDPFLNQEPTPEPEVPAA